MRATALRRLRGMTQVELAEAAGSTQRAISHYETFGGYPPAPTLIAIAKALNVSADELLGINPPRPDARAEDQEMRRLWEEVSARVRTPREGSARRHSPH
jgi:transcriptional regulator with XRE-family HTH domain